MNSGDEVMDTVIRWFGNGNTREKVVVKESTVG
jgi:hypothetical protein